MQDKGDKVTYLAEYRKSIVGKKSVGLVHEEVSTDELLESPVFALDEPVCPLALYARHTIGYHSNSSSSSSSSSSTPCLNKNCAIIHSFISLTNVDRFS